MTDNERIHGQKLSEEERVITCKHRNVKVDRETDTFICRDCKQPLDEKTKAKIKEWW